MFARAGLFDDSRFVFQERQHHPESHKILWDIPQFRIHLQFRQIVIEQRAHREDRAPGEKSAGHSDYTGRNPGIPFPEKKAAQSEGECQDGVDGEVGATVQLIVDRPDSHTGKDDSHKDVEPRRPCVGHKCEDGGTEEYNRKSRGHSSKYVPVKTGYNRVKYHRNAKQCQQSEPFRPDFNGANHGRSKDHSGKLQSGNVNRLDNYFQRALVSFECLNEEVQKNQCPRVGPKPNASRGGVFPQR